MLCIICETLGLIAGIAVIVVLVVSCVCLSLVIILIIKFRTKKLGNCHLAFTRSISQAKGGEDIPGLVDNKGSHSPAEQRTPEPQVVKMSILIEETEKEEVTVVANSVTEPSTEEMLLSDHSQEEKSKYIEEEEVPERVEESKSKVTRRPERISSGSMPVSKRELKEIKDIVVRIEKKKMDQRYHGQDKTELKLDVTSKTREEIAAIRNTQEEMRKL